MQNKHKPPITNIGSVSLIMIFIVLCMVTFAILSLSESTSDYKFTEKLATHTTDYYSASSNAEHTLSEIDGILRETVQDILPAYVNHNENTNTNTSTNANTSTITSTHVKSDADESLKDFTNVFFNAVNEAITDADIPAIAELSCSLDTDDMIYISYQVPINDSQQLAVRLRVSPSEVQSATQDSKKSGYYTIVSWQTIQSETWHGDDSIQLIK